MNMNMIINEDRFEEEALFDLVTKLGDDLLLLVMTRLSSFCELWKQINARPTNHPLMMMIVGCILAVVCVVCWTNRGNVNLLQKLKNSVAQEGEEERNNVMAENGKRKRSFLQLEERNAMDALLMSKSSVGKTCHLEYWKDVGKSSAVIAMKGRRSHMEDRYTVEENINQDTGVSFYGVFDGHGGVLASNFAKNVLSRNICEKINQIVKLQRNLRKQQHQQQKQLILNSNNWWSDDDDYFQKVPTSRKIIEVTTTPSNRIILVYNYLGRRREENEPEESRERAGHGRRNPPEFYLHKGRIDFKNLLIDEVLAGDAKLLNLSETASDFAGSTALMAIVYGHYLIVANVGDSRGVLCDHSGRALALTTDHKPQSDKEKQRILASGGYLLHRGVWRVGGVLATSRALGDLPLKTNNMVIAEPDVSFYDLNVHKPLFLILATDGLWDRLTNEEACAFAMEHLHEHDFGTNSLALLAYEKGSTDNITVLIVLFSHGKKFRAQTLAKLNSNSNSKNNNNKKNRQN